MRVIARSIWLPKSGNTVEEYEDSCCPTEPLEADIDIFNCAIADGATETSFADIWARLLTKAYCDDEAARQSLPKVLPSLQRLWLEQVGSRPLQWYAAEKVRDGAFSTLLGLSITEGESQTINWSAIAIGDSCLFQIRNDDLVCAFPLTSSDQFDNRPVLISSNPAFNEKAFERSVSATGIVKSGDEFYLMTDALACWLLRSIENEQTPWQTLRGFTDYGQQEAFEAWVNETRQAGQMRNDDVTLLYLTIE